MGAALYSVEAKCFRSPVTSGSIMSRTSLLVPALILSLTASAFVTGCANNRDGNAHARSTVSSATDSRQELVAAKAEIGKAITDLDLITRHGDLKPAFAAFSDDVAAVQKREKTVRSERETMEANSDAYIKEWQGSGAQYTNDDLRKSSIDRQAAVKQRFADVTKSYRDLEEQYRPFITTLSELQNSLANDLTSAAVDTVKPVAATAVSNGEKVQTQIDVVIGQLDGMISSLSAGTPDATKK